MFALTGATIFTGDEWLDDHAVIVAGKTILDVVPCEQLQKRYPEAFQNEYRLEKGIIAPGLIDLQINGAGGVFFTDDASVSALQTMSRQLATLGTTGFMPTVISAPAEAHRQAQNAVDEGLQLGIPGLLGIHIEGPFFSEEKRGCHPMNAIRMMNESDRVRLCSPTLGARIITLAPERVAEEDIRALVRAGNLVCIGHTNASYEDVQVALAAGAVGFTHLYNAMSNMVGRSPNVVGAALECDAAWCGIICDTHHVHAASIRLAQKIKPKGKLILVSDAMSTLGAKEKSFRLNDEIIFERDGRLVNAEGKLAGSAISLLDGVRLAHQWAGIALDEALRMGSLYPARALGIDHAYGRIAKDYVADIVCLDTDLSLTGVIQQGQWVRQKTG